MNDIKRIFKRAAVTAVIILIYGVLVKSEYVYLGMFSGSVMSIFVFYLLCLDLKSIAASENISRKRGFIGYAKRYAIYGIYLGIMAHFFGLPMLLGSAIGLLNVKANILLIILSENILKLRDKYLRCRNERRVLTDEIRSNRVRNTPFGGRTKNCIFSPSS